MANSKLIETSDHPEMSAKRHRTMQPLAYFCLLQDQRHIAEGVILPSGQFALSWDGLCHSHGVFPSFDIFKGMQAKRAGRIIKQVALPPDEPSRTFYLQRNEDWSGISGTGLVAVGFEFDHLVVLHWLDKNGSTFWYESVAMVERVHGHEGRTQITRCSSSRQKEDFTLQVTNRT